MRVTGRASLFHLIARLLPFLGGVKSRAIACVCIGLVRSAVSVSVIWLVKGLVDNVFTGGHYERLPGYCAVYAAVVGLRVVLDNVFVRLDTAITEQVALNIRSAVYDRLISVSPSSISRFNIGALLNHLSADASRAETLIYSGPFSAFANALAAVVFTVTLLVLSPALTLCTLCVAPVLAFIAVRFSKRMRRTARINRRRTSAWMSLAEERLAATPLIQIFTAERSEGALFRSRLGIARRAALGAARQQATLSTVTEIVGFLGGLVVLALGAEEIHRGALTVGGMIAFLGSAGSLYSPIRSLARYRGRFERAAASAERVLQLLDLPSAVVESPTARPLRPGPGAVEFRDVHFSYRQGQPVLDGMSLTIEPGETVAIVGPSGAGKSTLARLLVRLQDPSFGSVLVDGEDIRDVTLESLRHRVCVVLQEPHLFRGSIRQQVRYGAPEADDEEVAAAIKAAHAHGFVGALPGRLFARLGPRGSGLSGGQQQRLSIARGLLREAPVLFLDEATSAVDSEAEELIQEAIQRRRGDRTLIIVSHRLSSVRHADRLVLLEHGRVVESGAPEALLASSTRCGELFASQLI